MSTDEGNKVMQSILKKAFEKASLELSNEEQETLAKAILYGNLHDLIDDIKWKKNFSESQGLLENLADQATQEHKNGMTEKGGWEK